MLSIFNKEFKSYFNSAIGFIFVGVFIFISGLFFAIYNILQSNGDYGSSFSNVRYLFIILVPVLTMKTLSEERRTKTDQLLLTSPLSTLDIVAGKFLAAVAVFLITLLITLVYPVILGFYTHVAIGEVFANYLGFFLLGSCLIAIGVFASSLTENQVISAVLTCGLVLFINIVDAIQGVIPVDSVSGFVFIVGIILIVTLFMYFMIKSIIFPALVFILGSLIAFLVLIINRPLLEGFGANFIQWMSVYHRYTPFTYGIIDISAIVFFISFACFFIFLTIQTIEKRRWS